MYHLIESHLPCSKCSKCSSVWPVMNKNPEINGPRVGSELKDPLKNPGPFCLSILPSSVSWWWMASWLQSGCHSSSIYPYRKASQAGKKRKKGQGNRTFIWEVLITDWGWTTFSLWNCVLCSPSPAVSGKRECNRLWPLMIHIVGWGTKLMSYCGVPRGQPSVSTTNYVRQGTIIVPMLQIRKP